MTDPIDAMLNSFPWMPPAPAHSHRTPALKTGKRGKPAKETALRAELRRRFPDIVELHADDGYSITHKRIGTVAHQLFEDHHATRLNVPTGELVTERQPATKGPSYYVDRGMIEEQFDYYVDATVTVRRAARAPDAKDLCTVCGNSLDTKDRTYCKTCKSGVQQTWRKATRPQTTKRTKLLPGDTDRARSTPTAPDPDLLARILGQRADPYLTVARPHTRIIDTDTTTITVIDFRTEQRDARRLNDDALIELAVDVAWHDGCAPADGGRSGVGNAHKTDIAFAVSIPNGVVIWVGEANATTGYDSTVIADLPAVGVTIAELIERSQPTRVRLKVIEELRHAASSLANAHPTAIADAYELRCIVTHELALAQPVAVQDLIGVAHPHGWDAARTKLTERDVTPVEAITYCSH